MIKETGVWLDDLNLPDTLPHYLKEWHCFSSVRDVITFIEEYYREFGCLPPLFAITHDLCDEHSIAESIRHPQANIFYTRYKIPTGWHFIKILLNFAKTHNCGLQKIALHGENERGKANIRYEVENYKKENNLEDPIVFNMNWKTKKKLIDK